MKKFIALLPVLLVTGGALADPYVMAKQRARGVVDQNNAEQSRIQRGSSDAQPVDPALQSTAQNITDLTADFTAFSKADKPDAAQKASLMNNLTTAAQGKKAKSDDVRKFADDLSIALTGNKKITTAQQKQLGTFAHAVFNGSHLTTAQADKIAEIAQKILTDAAVPTEAVDNVVADLKKIAAATK